MAAVRKSGKKNGRKGSLAVVFWLAFFIIIVCLFVINLGKIQQTMKDSPFSQWLNRNEESGILPSAVPDEVPTVPVVESPVPISETQTGISVVVPPAQPARPQSQTEEASPQQPAPAAQTSSQQPNVATQESPAMRNRNIYLINIDPDGGVSRISVNRQLPVSDTPMGDVLNSLLAGPSSQEQGRGLVSLVPVGTKILNATVRGSTAYISFNEEFQYNTYGMEGYAASVRQIIWTVTEFSNIEDVQILIEGSRIDYLGEGIWIGSPLNRSF